MSEDETTAPTEPTAYARAADYIDNELRITRMMVTIMLFAAAWCDLAIGALMFTSWAAGAMGVPSLSLHFAYIPVWVWASTAMVAGLLQLFERTRVAGLVAATLWHASFAFPFVIMGLREPSTGPHYAVAIYLAASFTRASKGGALIWLRGSRRRL